MRRRTGTPVPRSTPWPPSSAAAPPPFQAHGRAVSFPPESKTKTLSGRTPGALRLNIQPAMRASAGSRRLLAVGLAVLVAASTELLPAAKGETMLTCAPGQYNPGTGTKCKVCGPAPTCSANEVLTGVCQGNRNDRMCVPSSQVAAHEYAFKFNGCCGGEGASTITKIITKVGAVKMTRFGCQVTCSMDASCAACWPCAGRMLAVCWPCAGRVLRRMLTLC